MIFTSKNFLPQNYKIMSRSIISLFLMFLSFIQIAKTQNFTLKATLKLENSKVEVQNIRFSHDGKTLAGGYADGTVVLWSIDSLKLITKIKAHRKQVSEVTFDKTGTKLATVSREGNCKLWDLTSYKKLGVYRCKPFISVDGEKLASVSFVTFSQDNTELYFGGDSGFLMSVDLTKKKPKSEVVFSTNYEDGRWYATITGGCISSNGKYIVISVGHLIDVIDLKNMLLVKNLPYNTGYLNDVIAISDKSQIATWSNDGKVNLWDLDKGEIIKTFQVTTEGNYSGATFSTDTRLLATGADGIIAKVWDVETGNQITTLEEHEKIVRICRFSPTENLLATASYDGTIKIWSYE